MVELAELVALPVEVIATLAEELVIQEVPQALEGQAQLEQLVPQGPEVLLF